METSEDFKDFLDKSIKRSSGFNKALRLIAVFALFIGVYALISRQSELIDTTENLIKKDIQQQSILQDTISKIKESIKKDTIECIGVSTGTRTSSGLPKYNFTMRISDSSITTLLERVDYYFDHYTYTPKLKSSDSAITNFRVQITNSWGCMNIVPVYLHYKTHQIDTIFFRMCDKLRLDLPELQ